MRFCYDLAALAALHQLVRFRGGDGVRNGAGCAIFLISLWCAPALADLAGTEASYRLATERVQKHAKDFCSTERPKANAR